MDRHLAFSAHHNGIARELITEIKVLKPVSIFGPVNEKDIIKFKFKGIWDTGATNNANIDRQNVEKMREK